MTKKPEVTVTHRAQAGGTGVLTPVELRDVLDAVPDRASLDITTTESQHEGRSWRVVATWTGEAN